MADPFDAPLPTTGQKPWSLNPAIEEVRGRVGDVEDFIDGPGLEERLVATAAELNPEALSDEFIASQISTSGTATQTELLGTIDEATSGFVSLSIDGDGTPVVSPSSGADGARILTPEAAAGDFEPIAEALWLPARLFDPADGAATVWGAADGKAWGWLLDDTLVEGVTAAVTVPEHWTKLIEVDVWWVPLTAAGGDTVWQGALYNLSDNNSLTSSGSSITTLGTDGAGTAAFRTRVLISGALSLAVDTAKLQRLLIRRNASNAADTYAGDVVFMGVRIVGSA